MKLRITSVNANTTAPKATAKMNATAIWTRFPLVTKSRNSLSM